MTKKISIIIHPVTRDLLYDWEPGMERLSPPVTNKILEWVKPFKIAEIKGIKSTFNNKTVDANLVLCPLLMEQLTTLRQSKSFRKVVDSVKEAQLQGSKLACLVAYTAMIGGRGVKVQESSQIPLTNGLNLTTATIPEAIIKAVDVLGHKSRNMNVVIYGANPLVYLIIKKLDYLAGQFYSYYYRTDILTSYYNALPVDYRKKMKIMSYPPTRYLKNADIIVNATRRFPNGLDESKLKRGAIVFDLSYPRTIDIKRKDVLLIDGVALIPPGNPKFNLNFGLPEGLCFPCMAEPMVLALEDNLVSYTLGKDISIDKAEKIYELALKHGFKIGPLTSHERVILK